MCLYLLFLLSLCVSSNPQHVDQAFFFPSSEDIVPWPVRWGEESHIQMAKGSVSLSGIGKCVLGRLTQQVGGMIFVTCKCLPSPSGEAANVTATRIPSWKESIFDKSLHRDARIGKLFAVIMNGCDNKLDVSLYDTLKSGSMEILQLSGFSDIKFKNGKDMSAVNNTLQKIDIRNSIIDNLLPHSFSGLQELQRISFNNVSINTISEYAFFNLRKLDYISFVRCNILEIRPLAVYKVNVAIMSIAHSTINRIHTHSFTHIRSHPYFCSSWPLELTIFYRQTTLPLVIFTHNLIREWDSEAFRDTRLNGLLLSFNVIGRMGTKAMEITFGYPKCKHFAAAFVGNYFQEVEGGAFTGLRVYDLSRLDGSHLTFSHNLFSKFEKFFLTISLEFLPLLIIQENVLPCDCKIKSQISSLPKDIARTVEESSLCYKNVEDMADIIHGMLKDFPRETRHPMLHKLTLAC